MPSLANLDINEVVRLYYEEKKTIQEICKILKVGYDTIARRCKKYNIILIPRYYQFNNIIGQRFGRWLVVKYLKKGRWECLCDCGNIKNVCRSTLINGDSRSCGCLAEELKFKGLNGISHAYWGRIRSAALKSGREFNISMQYVWDLYEKQNRRCALSNIEIVFEKRSHHCINQTASLDRIDNSKGYIEGNVQWVHKMVNRMKSVFDQEDFIKMCESITNVKNHKYGNLHNNMIISADVFVKKYSTRKQRTVTKEPT